MKPIQEQIADCLSLGYRNDAAQAKVAHDIVLLAMHRCGFKANSTVKGGVLMSSLTGDVRRATMDMDIDFINYSISNASIARFVKRMTKAMPEAEIRMIGSPMELKHEDYRGKRIYIAVKDASISRRIRTKIDIGVHTIEELAQVEFSFHTGSGEEMVNLLANSPEQIFAEKLLSLLRHGANTNRPKDIFDMYYLSSRLNMERLRNYIALTIYRNPKCRANNHADMIRLVRLIFGLNTFVVKLTRARANWLQISTHVALTALDHFLAELA